MTACLETFVSQNAVGLRCTVWPHRQTTTRLVLSVLLQDSVKVVNSSIVGERAFAEVVSMSAINNEKYERSRLSFVWDFPMRWTGGTVDKMVHTYLTASRPGRRKTKH